jgi:integrase
MPGKQAKAVTPPMLRRMLRRTSRTPFHARDRAMLSVKAGLRACETARLEWSIVLDARGKVTDILAIHDAIAKKRGGRRIPMHPDLRHALRSLLRDKRTLRAGHPLRPWRLFAPDQRGQLVCGVVQRARLRGMLVALRPTNLHHRCRAQRPPQRLQPARRPAARRAPIYRDD